MLDFTRRNVPETVTTVDNNLIKSLIQMLNTYFLTFVAKHEDEEIPECNRATIEPFFLFALVWSIGASGNENGRPKSAQKLRELMDESGCTTGPPVADGTDIFDYKYDLAQLKWIPWLDTIPPFAIPKGAEFADILVPTVDTVRTGEGRLAVRRPKRQFTHADIFRSLQLSRNCNQCLAGMP